LLQQGANPLRPRHNRFSGFPGPRFLLFVTFVPFVLPPLKSQISDFQFRSFLLLARSDLSDPSAPVLCPQARPLTLNSPTINQHVLTISAFQHFSVSAFAYVVEWALQGYGPASKRSLDEEQIFIRDGELLG